MSGYWHRALLHLSDLSNREFYVLLSALQYPIAHSLRSATNTSIDPINALRSNQPIDTLSRTQIDLKSSAYHFLCF